MNSAHLHEVDILEIAQKCVYCGYCSVCPTFKEWSTDSFIRESFCRGKESTKL